MKSLRRRPVTVCIAYFCLHLAAQLSACLFEVAPGISVWYPPAGLALSLLVMLGPRYAWVVFAANIAGAVAVPGFPVWWAPILFPLLITANYTLVAYLVRRYMGQQLLPRTAGGILPFAAVLIAAPVATSVIGTFIVMLMGELKPGSFMESVSRWWLGDVAGLLTVLPAIMVFVAPWVQQKPHPFQQWRWEWGFLGSVGAKAAVLLGSIWLAFFPTDFLPDGTLYICFLPLIWICLHHGLPGGTLATLVLIMGSLFGMNQHGPHTDAALIDFMLFGLTVAVLGLGLGSAVTRRNEAQAELAAGRARFDRVIEGAQLGLWDWDVASDEVVHNNRCAEILHRAPDELDRTRDGWNRNVLASDRARKEESLHAHLHGQTPMYECEYRIQTADGRWRWIETRGSVVQRSSDGKPELVSGTHRDVTDRKVAEAAAKRLLAIVETTTDFVLTIDAHGHIVFANSALLNLLGLSDLARLHGQTFLSVFPPTSADSVQAEIIPRSMSKGSSHGELLLRDGRQRQIPVSYVTIVHHAEDDEPSLLSFVMRDISAQKQAEAANLERERKILQVQKAESLSVLAGGIAHDFNNLLTAIIGNASLLREELLPGERTQGPLDQIEIAAGRAAELCGNMLAYAGRFRAAKADINVNTIVEESRELIHAAISKKIRIETNLSPDLSPIHGSALQLQQVIINLALNASEAIGDKAGVIALRTSLRQLTPKEMAESFDQPAASNGRYVILEIKDSGCGIPDDIRGKIFEPYFTTKSNGHGLGLAAVNGIVRAHGGAVTVESTIGQGSTFRVLLPATKAASGGSSLAAAGPERCHGSGLALIVDDEPFVREVVAKLIERFGFKTVTAADGIEGVARFKDHHRDLKFVLTDLTMPRMNGDEAMAEMRRINASIPVILMSGYPEKMAADHFALASPSALLAKPLRREVLEKTINQVLQRT